MVNQVDLKEQYYGTHFVRNEDLWGLCFDHVEVFIHTIDTTLHNTPLEIIITP